MIKGLIFDVGGVLFIPGTMEEFFQQLAHVFKQDIPRIREVFEKHWEALELGTCSTKEFWNTFLGELKQTASIEELNHALYTKDGVNTELVKLIHMLRKRYTISLLTNHTREWLEKELHEHQLEQEFDRVFASYELGLRKPDPKIFQVVLEQLNMKPDEVVFIDDLLENIAAAKKIGMHTVLYQNVTQLKEAFK